MMTREIPSLAERLVRWSLAPWERHAVLGDLQEEASAIAAERGEVVARRWSWRQALWSIWPNAVRRLKGDDRRLKEFHSNLGLAMLWTLSLLGAVFSPQMRRDPYRVAVNAVWLLFTASRVLNALFRRQLRPAIESGSSLLRFVAYGSVSLVLLLAFRLGPTGYFAVGVGTLTLLNVLHRPRSLSTEPQSFVVGRGSTLDPDHDRYLSLDVPNVPLGLSPVVLCRADNHGLGDAGSMPALYAPTIERRFKPNRRIRACAVVNVTGPRVQGAIELVDEAGSVLRHLSVPVDVGQLEEVPATWDDVADRDPAKHFGQIDQTLEFAGLLPGKYRLRVTVSDGERVAHRDEPIEVLA